MIPPSPFCHVDADAFFASVLVRKDPRLAGKPLFALGMGGGCVIAASYEAKAKGVKTGMRVADARKLCPEAIERLSDFAEACRASAEIEEILRREFPVVEQMSVDEWFLDVRLRAGGMPTDVHAWAKHLQQTVARSVSLTVSIGIAPTKLLAKMAGEYRKPGGITEIPNSAFGIRNFLQDRPAAAVPGIGRKRTVHADTHGWKTSWDFAKAPTEMVIHLFGRPGAELQQELLGIPVHAVEEDDRPPQSISRCRSFRRTSARETVYAHLLEHLTYTVMKLRREELACRHVSVWLRDQEYESEGVRRTLPRPMDTEEELLPYVRQCFEELWRTEHYTTQVGLALFGLPPGGMLQYSLFDAPERTERRQDIQSALDAIHRRFGKDAVIRGATALSGKQRVRRETLYGDAGMEGKPTVFLPRLTVGQA